MSEEGRRRGGRVAAALLVGAALAGGWWRHRASDDGASGSRRVPERPEPADGAPRSRGDHDAGSAGAHDAGAHDRHDHDGGDRDAGDHGRDAPVREAGGRDVTDHPITDHKDSLGIIEHLQATGRFCRDTLAGGILHWGERSFRETTHEDSLHLTVSGNRLTAHIDRLSPLRYEHSSWVARYSLTRAVAHMLVHARDALLRLLTGRSGHHRLELVCERRRVLEEGEGAPEGSVVEGALVEDAADGEQITPEDVARHVAEEVAAGSLAGDATVEDATVEDAAEGPDGGPRGPEDGDVAPGPRSGDAARPAPASGGRGADGPWRLPFTMIDEAIEILDAEAAPWSIQLEVRLEGRLDEDRLRGAVVEGLLRHPLAHARRVPSRASERGHVWEVTEDLQVDPVRVMDCPDEAAMSAARAELLSLPVPLLESPPVRIGLARRPDGDHLLVNANHVAFDGFGTLRVLRSIGRAYGDEPDPLPDVDLREARDLERLLGSPDRETRWARRRMLAEKALDLLGAPARLAPDGGRDEPGYGFHHVRLSERRTRAVLAAAEGPSTVNDLLLTALHLAVVGWNADHGVTPRRIGVLVPVNLWPERPDGLVGNYTLPVRVTTTRDAQTSLPDVLASITEQTRTIKESNTAAALIEVLGRPAGLPIWAKRALPGLLWLTGNRLVDTAQLSNLGRIEEAPRFGDAGEVSELWFSPPARMPLGLSVGVATVRDRLHLAFRYRHRLLGPRAAHRFAALYLLGLDLVAGD